MTNLQKCKKYFLKTRLEDAIENTICKLKKIIKTVNFIDQGSKCSVSPRIDTYSMLRKYIT